MALKFALVADARRPECVPLMILRTLADSGALPLTEAGWLDDSNCHEIAGLLLRDIAAANPPIKWEWFVGECPVIGEHSWLECDGWAIDASNGSKRPIIVQASDQYRANIKAANIALALNHLDRVT